MDGIRTSTLFIDVTDGFCAAETLAVTIRVKDVNDVPVLRPREIEMTLFEGNVSALLNYATLK